MVNNYFQQYPLVYFVYFCFKTSKKCINARYFIYSSTDNVCQMSKNCSNSVNYSCSSCRMKICSACLHKHECERKQFTFVRYDQKLDSLQPWCEDHNTYANTVCIDCNDRFICTYCVHRGHKQHKLETIEKCVENARHRIMDESKDFIRVRKKVLQDGLGKLKLFRQEVVVELKERIQKKLKVRLDELLNAQEVILSNFDNAVSTCEYQLKYSDSLEASIVQMPHKNTFEILSENADSGKRLNNVFSMYFLETYVNTNFSEAEPLGQIVISSTERPYVSRIDYDENFKTNLDNIYESRIEKQKDFKQLMECVNGEQSCTLYFFVFVINMRCNRKICLFCIRQHNLNRCDRSRK